MDFDNLNRVCWRNHNGEVYLSIDFSFVDDYVVFHLIVRIHEILQSCALSSVKVLINLENSDLSFNTHALIRKYSKENQKVIFKAAIFGMNSTTTLFYKIYKKVTFSKSVPFITEQEALNYLFPTNSI